MQVKGIDAMDNQKEVILRIENLTKIYGTEKVISNANIEIEKGRTLGLVGESGSGKSTIGRCIMGISKISKGRILYENEDISKYDSKKLKEFRKNIQMIFQDPYSSFDPKKDFGFSLKESILSHKLVDKKTADKKVDEILEKVGLDIDLKHRYPSQLSGGQCQRMNIARALLLMPKLLICDEPVSALDMSIQAQILNLLKEIQKEYNLAYLFISHDLSVTKYMSDDVAVIYNGKIVEKGKNQDVLTHPKHPYTKFLLDSILPNSPYKRSIKRDVKHSTEKATEGCTFYNRCSKRMDMCKNKQPIEKRISGGHLVECFLTGEIE